MTSLLPRTAAAALDCAARCLPPRALLDLAEAAGGSWYRLASERRRIAEENVRIAFGDSLHDAERKRIVRGSFRAMGRVFAELALARRLLSPGRQAEERLALLGDWAQLEADHRAGRAGIVVTGHLGNWEVGAHAVRSRGVPLRAMARPVANPVVEGLLLRGRGGAHRVIAKTGGLSAVVRTLREGAWVAMLADQNAGRHGEFVPFFGLEASTFPTPAALALRLGVPLYFGACLRREGEAMGFDVHLERLLPASGAAPAQPEALKALILRLNGLLEAAIRRAPDQYNWSHRRWKTRPPGRDSAEPGQPSYARLWPLGADGAPIHGRVPM